MHRINYYPINKNELRYPEYSFIRPLNSWGQKCAVVWGLAITFKGFQISEVCTEYLKSTCKNVCMLLIKYSKINLISQSAHVMV